MRPAIKVVLLTSGLVLASASAQAVTVSWTDWTGAGGTQADGSLLVGATSVGVHYDGPIIFAQTGCGTNYWTEGSPAPYTGGSVDNAPPGCDIVALSAGGLKTITFSEAILDPYIALVSWNGNVVEFSADIEIISQGAGFWGNGTMVLNADGDGFTGVGEVHGIIRLSGSFTSISFTDTSENWHGFTVGVAGLGEPPIDTPEPGMLGLLGLGLMGMASMRRRKS